MAAALEDTPISYEDLAAIEKDFEDVEVEIIRQQITLTTPLYTHRQKATSQIPNFWPLVLEQAPPDIDQYIQPSDSALLLSSLTTLSVSHFEASDTTADPRSVNIKWEFAENEYFEDKVLEKKFWYRRKEDGWSGLVSEPVGIKWKSKERDLTGGLLGLVVEAWEEEKKRKELSANGAKKGGKKGLSEKQKALKKKIENTGMGGMSFFAWFGFIGRRVTEEESREATRLDNENREKRRKGVKVEEKASVEVDEDDEDDLGDELEIFPDGDDLAVAITDDLWPGAIKYFTQAQEQDALSDADFESDDENISDLDDAQHSDGEDSDAPPSKRQKPL